MSSFTIPTSAVADTHERRVRWEPCFNTTDETIPPFACMQLRRPKDFNEQQAAKNTDDMQEFLCQHERAGMVVWDVTKCNADAESRQDASEFVFNGKLPIAPLSYGRCTADYPSQVLHNGKKDSLPNLRSCGPVVNTWYVLSGRTAFTCLSHDAANAIGGDVHTVWVRPNTSRIIPATGRWTISGGDANAYLDFAVGSNVLAIERIDSEDNETTKGWIKIERSGIYLFSFQAKLSSSSAPRSAALSVTLYKRLKGNDEDNPGEAEPTIYVAERDMDVEATMNESYQGVVLQRTAENVAFSGFDRLNRGDYLRLRNTSAHAISLARGSFSIVNVGGYNDPITGRGGYQPDTDD